MLYYGLIFLPKNGRFEGVHPHCDNPAMSLHEAIATSSDKLRTLTRSRDIGVLSTGKVGSTHWDHDPKDPRLRQDQTHKRHKPLLPEVPILLQLQFAKDQLSIFHKGTSHMLQRPFEILCAVAISKLNQLNISNINSTRPLWVTYFGIFGCLQLAAACRHHRPAGRFGRDGC